MDETLMLDFVFTGAVLVMSYRGRDVECVTILRVSPIESPLQIDKSRYTPIRHSTLLYRGTGVPGVEWSE